MSVTTDSTPVRPGRALAMLAAGPVVSGIGLAVAGTAGSARNTCQTNAFVASLIHKKSASCLAVDVRFDVGLVVAALGLVLTLVAVVWAVRVGRRSAAAGAPWPVRRVMESAAGWLDARVPGSVGPQPRVRRGYLTALSVGLILAAGAGVASAWHSHSVSEQTAALHREQAAFNRAAVALSLLALPSGIHQEPSASCVGGGSQVCGRSMLTPAQVQPILERLLGGRSNTAVDDEQAPWCSTGPTCQVLVKGRLDGYPAVGTADSHLLVVRHGRPPAGAIPTQTGHGHVFWLGSDISIWITPPGPAGCAQANDCN